MVKVAIVGDSFTDQFYFGRVDRISPEAPVPVLDIERMEVRGGGTLNVANNLRSLGIIPHVFTITDLLFPYPINSPSNCSPLLKKRFVAQNHQLLRVDEPKRYSPLDLERMVYPSDKEYDIIAFIDYNKGIIRGGKATIVDTKKEDLSLFRGSQYLKINQKEWNRAKNKDFPHAFITRGKEGIDYYKDGRFVINSRNNTGKEVIDVTGAGDTVMAILIYCLARGITDPLRIMNLANKAAGIVITRFGTSTISLADLK